jgi:hypothetical protein
MNQQEIAAIMRRVAVAVAALPPLTPEQEQQCISEMVRLHHSVPGHWLCELDYGLGGVQFRHEDMQMMAIFTMSCHQDGKCWIHASIARTDRIPSYDELRKLKTEFIGRDRKAIMVLPAEAEHVNIHPNTLYLFCCLDGDPLPDFTCGSGSL